MEIDTIYTPEFDISEAEDGWVVRIPFIDASTPTRDHWEVVARSKVIKDWLDANLAFWEPAFTGEEDQPNIMCMWELCYAIFLRDHDDAMLMKLRFA